MLRLLFFLLLAAPCAYSQTTLLEAVSLGDFPTVRRLLDEGVDLEKEELGVHALCKAAKLGRIDLVCVLLEHGAETQFVFSAETPPLITAGDNVEIIKLLVEFGASIHGGNYVASSARCAISYGHIHALRYLVSQGVSPLGGSMVCVTGLQDAAYAGNMDIAEILLDHGADVNQSFCLSPPLTIASEKGNLNMVKLFVARGADVNRRSGVYDKVGKLPPTSLSLALKNGHWEILRYLVRRGGELGELEKREPVLTALVFGKCRKAFRRMKNGFDAAKALNAVARAGDLRTVKFLLRHGVTLNGVDADGRTALFVAVKAKQTKMYKYLVEQGADVNTADKDSMTSLLVAIEGQDLDGIKYLLSKGADIHAKGKWGQSVLSYARSPDVIHYLIEQGAEVSAVGKADLTLLLKDISREIDVVGCINQINNLIAQGADVNHKDDKGRTPFMIAVDEGATLFMKALVNAGADPLEPDSSGLTPIQHAAVRWRNFEVFKYLAAHGADLHARTPEGQTLLMLAAKETSSLDKVQYLVAHGVNPYARDPQGRSALDYAIHDAYNIHDQIVENRDVIQYLANLRVPMHDSLLTSHQLLKYALIIKDWDKAAGLISECPDLVAAVWEEFSADEPELASFLLAHGANIEVLNHWDETPLMAVADDFRKARALVAQGADIHTKSKYSGSVLFRAYGNEDVIRYWVGQGVDINAQNYRGETVLMGAVGRPWRLALLLELGADPNIKDHEGKTAVDHARELGYVRVAQYLTEQGAR